MSDYEPSLEILDKRYRVVKKLGGGAFVEIYKGKPTRHQSPLLLTHS